MEIANALWRRLKKQIAVAFIAIQMSPLMPKILIGISLLLLSLSAVFGVLNTNKMKDLRTEIATVTSAAARRPVAKPQDVSVPANAAKTTLAETEGKAARAEAELAKASSEKAELQEKLQITQTELAQLQKRIEEMDGKGLMPTPLPGSSVAELQAQLDDARRQLDAADKERTLLLEKGKQQPQQQQGATAVEQTVKHRDPAARKPGVSGTVLAVNQAYNFVVLNLGARQGVESNSEMLVLRRGALIGKIVISSVEPATAIGDIITNSLARGVQVQPGDSVIYAGSSSSPP